MIFFSSETHDTLFKDSFDIFQMSKFLEVPRSCRQNVIFFTPMIILIDEDKRRLNTCNILRNMQRSLQLLLGEGRTFKIKKKSLNTEIIVYFSMLSLGIFEYLAPIWSV